MKIIDAEEKNKLRKIFDIFVKKMKKREHQNMSGYCFWKFNVVSLIFHRLRQPKYSLRDTLYPRRKSISGCIFLRVCRKATIDNAWAMWVYSALSLSFSLRD